MTLKPALAVDGKIVLPKIDLDRALAGLQQPPAAETSAAKPVEAGGSGDSILTNLTAKLSIEANEIVYHKQAIRSVAIELDAKGGAVAVPRLSATLPGDMVLDAKSTMSGDPNRPTVSGEFSLVGPKLRDTLKWLEVDVSQVPESKLARLSLKGPHVLGRRQCAGHGHHLRARRREGHRQCGGELHRAAHHRDDARFRHARSRSFPRQAGRRRQAGVDRVGAGTYCGATRSGGPIRRVQDQDR